jgi:UDP-N-acetylglucosamine 1-carboxyvinyltransferase
LAVAKVTPTVIAETAKPLERALCVEGGFSLCGEVAIGGSKNASLPIIAAALLATEGQTRLIGVPHISDVEVMCDILQGLGARVRWHGDALDIDATGLYGAEVDSELGQRIRASTYLFGVLLARFGEAKVPYPGGDRIGVRPIDFHLAGLRAMGAEVSTEAGCLVGVGRLSEASIYLERPSVGATIHLMMAAALGKDSQTTTLSNAAMDPEIMDVARFLSAMGARIYGAGTSTIKVVAVRKLTGATYEVIPDRLEAGTFLMSAAASRGDITVTGVISEHLTAVIAKLQQMGVRMEVLGDSIRARVDRRLSATDVLAEEYPGFPTDLQPCIAALLVTASGDSMVTDLVWTDRFQYTDEFVRMGGQVKVVGSSVRIQGVSGLSPAEVTANDIRGGAALVLASLGAQGKSTIYGVHHLDRGYAGLIDKLMGLGARIDELEL